VRNCQPHFTYSPAKRKTTIYYRRTVVKQVLSIEIGTPTCAKRLEDVDDTTYLTFYQQLTISQIKRDITIKRQ